MENIEITVLFDFVEVTAPSVIPFQASEIHLKDG